MDKEFGQLDPNPKSVYLEHCERFARYNMAKEVIPIESYVIKTKDIIDETFAKYDPSTINIEESFLAKAAGAQPLNSRGRAKQYFNDKVPGLVRLKTMYATQDTLKKALFG